MSVCVSYDRVDEVLLERKKRGDSVSNGMGSYVRLVVIMVMVNDVGVLLLFGGERFSGTRTPLNKDIGGATYAPMEQVRRQSVM